MRFPSREDTIVAVSTAWQPSPLGIVRLSGPRSFALAEQLAGGGIEWPAVFPACVPVRIAVAPCGVWPAELLAFRAPRSYTGQDVVEIHTVGALPLLRSICDLLIERGARRALAGEFTARAFLGGRLRHDQVDGVLALLRAGDDGALRQAARQVRETRVARWTQLAAELLDLLAAVEAGIDFADEEDVRFAAPADVAARLDRCLAMLPADAGAEAPALRAARPHLALVGLPNAGKSALFNALVGCERAIVSPVVGTTRDVLACELAIGAHAVVLQDCAGLGGAVDDLDLAAHRAAERTADQADLVLWVHAIDAAWTPDERSACERIDVGRRLLVLSKADLCDANAAAQPPRFDIQVAVSARTGAGLTALHGEIARWLDLRSANDGASAELEVGAIRDALERAQGFVDARAEVLESPELLALELRSASEMLRRASELPTDEAVLSRIFARFCVGK